ncbi:SPOSA6832_04296, partial [Sporobolomyces salmonicolor]
MYDVDGAVGDKENLQPRRRAVSGQAVGGSTTGSERERHKQQLEDLRHRLITSHEKDVAKLQGKISRLEASRDELVKEKNESSKEVHGLKSEIRHLTSKLTKTESLLTKHQSSLPLLQSKLASLQASHELSRQRKDAELAEIAAKLADVEGALQRKTEELSAERERADIWETSAKREGKARSEEAAAAEKVVQGLREEVREVRVIALQAERLRRVKLTRQLDDRATQVGALAEYSQGLEETVSVLSEQLDALNSDYTSLLELWRSDRALLVEERSEKEWRQRARSDAREMTGLREDVGDLEELRECERMCERDGEQVWRLRRREWNAEKEKMKVDYEVVEGE